MNSSKRNKIREKSKTKQKIDKERRDWTNPSRKTVKKERNKNRKRALALKK